MSTELIPDQPKHWYCRVSETVPQDNSKGIRVATRKAELVYGVMETKKGARDVTTTTIIGEVHHTLKGPTASSSIEEMAKRYNIEGKLPPEKGVRVRADGCSFKDRETPSLIEATDLRRAISYRKP